MSSTSSHDLDSASLIARIRAGDVPAEFVAMAARGFLPLAQDDLVAVLAFLSRHDEPEIAGAARKSFAELPLRVVSSLATNVAARAEDLEYLASASTNPAVLEAIARNRSTSDETFELLARSATPALQEIIVINQERILRRPAILDALLENPALANDVRRRVVETREEFFEKKARRAEEAELAGIDLALLDAAQQAELDALVAQALEQEELAPTPPLLTEAEIAAELEKPDSAWIRLLSMSVGQKVQCAFRGGATERRILIRERNKLIATAVIRSPRVTENEAESFAGMRNVDDEVLRLISMNRGWMSKYPIMIALVKNPKAPVGVVLPLVNRLNLRDLKTLASDKGVSEAVRQYARRIYLTRKV